jgi:hypothetical protein
VEFWRKENDLYSRRYTDFRSRFIVRHQADELGNQAQDGAAGTFKAVRGLLQ